MSKVTVHRFHPTVGGDPELFVVRAGSGWMIPAGVFMQKIGSMIEVTDPYNSRRKFKKALDIGYDNASVECNLPVHTCLEGANRSMLSMIRRMGVEVRAAARKAGIRGELRLSADPVRRVPKKYLSAPGAAEFGCSPALVPALVGDKIVAETVTAKLPLEPIRSTGFHIHMAGNIPYSSPPAGVSALWRQQFRQSEEATRAVLYIDLFLGLMDVILTPDVRGSRIRRNDIGYGRAGEHRIHNYTGDVWGLEYRVCSGWPMHAPPWTWFAQSAMRMALYIAASDTKDVFLKEFSPLETARIINEVDQGAAYSRWVALRGFMDATIGQSSSLSATNDSLWGINQARLDALLNLCPEVPVLDKMAPKKLNTLEERWNEGYLYWNSAWHERASRGGAGPSQAQVSRFLARWELDKEYRRTA